jgi:hypothetical protein
LDLDALEVMVPIVSPCAVLLSVVMGVGFDLGMPISSKVCRYGMEHLHP